MLEGKEGLQMRSRLSPLGGIFGGVLLALVAVGTVAGYAGQVVATVEVSAPTGPQLCGTSIAVSAFLQTTDGAVIDGRLVTWSFVSGNVTGDTIAQATSTTNASGIATSHVTLACSPHGVVLGAVSDEVSGTVTITTSGQGLPRTDTVPASSFPMIALAALAVLIGTGTILRRFATARR
jgi:hypothetical protein